MLSKKKDFSRKNVYLQEKVLFVITHSNKRDSKEKIHHESNNCKRFNASKLGMLSSRNS